MSSVVTHTLKTVRRQVVDLRLPAPPPDDAEAFILRDNRSPHSINVELSPADFAQFVAVVNKVYKDVMGG